jgi:hypothetical protein
LPYIREDVNLELLRSLMGLWKQELAGWKERLEAVGKARFHARSRFNTRSCRDRGLCNLLQGRLRTDWRKSRYEHGLGNLQTWIWLCCPCDLRQIPFSSLCFFIP